MPPSSEQSLHYPTDLPSPPPLDEFSSESNSADVRRGWSLEQKVTISGIVLVVVTLMISLGVNIVTDFVESGKGPEFGYRLDVDPSLYEDLGANRYPYNSGAQYPSFSSTIAIEGACISDPYYACGGSGVIISSRWVLTAAHVVEMLVLDETYVAVGSDYENAEAWFVAEAFYIHPSWGGEEELDLGFDIALIRLSDSISGVYPSSWANHEGVDSRLLDATIFISGFGLYSDYEESFCDSACLDDGGEYYSQRRAWTNTLDRILESPAKDDGNDLMELRGGHLVYDFDSPNEDKNALTSGNLGFNIFTEQEYSYAGEGDSSPNPLPLEGTSVPGDSGGPIFAKIGSKWTVIGITSHGSVVSDYGDVSFNTRVSVHAEWICSISNAHGYISGC